MYASELDTYSELNSFFKSLKLPYAQSPIKIMVNYNYHSNIGLLF